MLFRDQFLATK